MHSASRTGLSTPPDSSQEIAITALTFLASDGERLEKFLSLTGLGPDNLRAAAADTGFLASVIGYLAADEPLLLAFASDAGLKPDDVVRAFHNLGGASPGADAE